MQLVTSAGTSVNCIPRIYKRFSFSGEILDYGGGRFDTAKEYVKERYGADVFVYDPYNRSPEHNHMVLSYFSQRPAKTVVCSNVLNVLPDVQDIYAVLERIKLLMASDGVLYIQIYKGPVVTNGEGIFTSRGFQRCVDIVWYLPFVEAVFPLGFGWRVELKDYIIRVYGPDCRRG